jgi:hypothetical protein
MSTPINIPIPIPSFSEADIANPAQHAAKLNSAFANILKVLNQLQQQSNK